MVFCAEFLLGVSIL